MPDFSNCEKDKAGNSYCYDYESGDVFVVRVEKAAINKVPQEVLLKLLRKESARVKDIGG
jgi:hypothetical protein